MVGSEQHDAADRSKGGCYKFRSVERGGEIYAGSGVCVRIVVVIEPPPRDKRNSGDGASGTGRAVYASRGSEAPAANKKYDIVRTSPENPSGGGKREIVSFRKCFEHGNLRSLNFPCCCVSKGRKKRFNSPVDHFFKIVRFFEGGKPLSCFILEPIMMTRLFYLSCFSRKSTPMVFL